MYHNYRVLGSTNQGSSIFFAPWGKERGFWDAEGLLDLKVPSFFVVRGQDDISSYEKGTKAIYKGAVNSNRYLLTYMNAKNNFGQNPPPADTLKI